MITPSLLELVILADNVGTSDYDLPDGWVLDGASHDHCLRTSSVGYLAKVFVNADINTVAVVHRGQKISRHMLQERDLNQKMVIDNVPLSPIGYFKSWLAKIFFNPDLNTFAAMHTGRMLVTDVITDTTLVLTDCFKSGTENCSKKLPLETTYALDFAQTVIEKYQGMTIIHIGYSLGGLHAHVCGYIYKQAAFTFDNPGAKEVLERVLEEKLDPAQTTHAFTVLSAPNVINMTNTHFGNVYQFEEYAESSSLFQRRKDRNDINFLIEKILQHGLDADCLYHGTTIPGLTDISDKFDAKSPIEIDPEIQGFMSPLSKRVVTAESWCVSHINTGSVFTGHSMIVVEGVILTREKFVPFVGYYHIIVNLAEQPEENELSDELREMRANGLVDVFARVNVIETDYHCFKARYRGWQTRSWADKNPKDVVNMISHIMTIETQRWIPYRKLKWEWGFWEDCPFDNCTSWVIKMLENHANIQYSKPISVPIWGVIRPRIPSKTKPGISTLCNLQ